MYVEWDFKATFSSGDGDDGDAGDAVCDIPTRHALCKFIVKSDLMPYLTKIGKMSNKTFSKTYGIFTEQTITR